VLGAGGMVDGGSYMAEHWDEMSPAERQQQGTLFLTNLASFGVRPAVKGYAHVMPPRLGGNGTTPHTGAPGQAADGTTVRAEDGTTTRPAIVDTATAPTHAADGATARPTRPRTRRSSTRPTRQP
jgi:hypothetical protein